MNAGYHSRSAGATQEWTEYDDMVLVMLNNVRMLILCVEPNQQCVTLVLITLRYDTCLRP